MKAKADRRMLAKRERKMSSDSFVKIASSPINWWDGFPLPVEYKPSPDKVLMQMKEAGYAGTELGGTLPSAPAELTPLLKEFDLELAAGWFGSQLLTQPFEQEKQKFVAFVKSLREMGAAVVVGADLSFTINKTLSRNLFPYRLPFLSAEQWEILCRGWEEFVRIAKDHGLKLGYHPHIGTIIIELWQIERLMAQASNLTLCVDSGHLALAGVDPLYVIDQYMERIVHLHLKSIRPHVVARVRNEPFPWEWAKIEGVFTIPGDGGIDFLPIFERLEQAEYKGWIVLEAEQNSLTSNPFLYAKLGRDYVKEVTTW